MTKKQLEAICNRINTVTNSPLAPYERDSQNRLRANIGNYHISYAYGGVSLHRMCNEGGGVSNVFGRGHMPKRELAGLLHAFLNGIDAAGK